MWFTGKDDTSAADYKTGANIKDIVAIIKLPSVLATVYYFKCGLPYFLGHY